MLLSYFHALKNPTFVSIVQFAFWELCSTTGTFSFTRNEYLVFPPLPYFLVKVEPHRFPACFASYTCALASRCATWLGST